MLLYGPARSGNRYARRGIIWVRTPRYYMGLRAAVLDMGLRAAVLDMGATVLY